MIRSSPLQDFQVAAVKNDLPCGLNKDILEAILARVIGSDGVVRVNEAKVCISEDVLISFRYNVKDLTWMTYTMSLVSVAFRSQQFARICIRSALPITSLIKLNIPSRES